MCTWILKGSMRLNIVASFRVPNPNQTPQVIFISVVYLQHKWHWNVRFHPYYIPWCSFIQLFLCYYVAVIVQNLLYLHMNFPKELIFITRHRIILNECIAMKISTWIASASMNVSHPLTNACSLFTCLKVAGLGGKNGNLKIVTSKITVRLKMDNPSD